MIRDTEYRCADIYTPVATFFGPISETFSVLEGTHVGNDIE